MPTFYSDEQRALQERFQTGRMADLLEQVIVHSEVQDAERAFIESRDMFFLASVDGEGQPTCSYKGGDPGFVKVLDPGTIAFPSYDGNETPFAEWKRIDLVQEALPPRDAGKTAEAGGTITVGEYETKLAAGEA